MSHPDPLAMKRLLGYLFIGVAAFAGLVGTLGFGVSWIFASTDRMGSAVMRDAAERCTIASVTFGCLGIYTLKSRMKVTSSGR